jgi:hypothetical protein
MALERSRGPYKKLNKRLVRAGFSYVAGGEEPDNYLYVNERSNKALWLCRAHETGDWFLILKKPIHRYH